LIFFSSASRMRTQGLGESVVLGTDINTHFGAGGWHGPIEQEILEDNDVSTAERFVNCAEATATGDMHGGIMAVTSNCCHQPRLHQQTQQFGPVPRVGGMGILRQRTWVTAFILLKHSGKKLGGRMLKMSISALLVRLTDAGENRFFGEKPCTTRKLAHSR